MASQDSNPKDAIARLKPSLHAIPPPALIALGLTMENGEAKYGLMNWRSTNVNASVYYNAALRHLLAWWDGEDNATDSGLPHLAHVMACCAILIDAEIGNNLIDDRPVAGPTAAFIDHLHDQRVAKVAADARAEAWADNIEGLATQRGPWPWPNATVEVAPRDTVTPASLADAVDALHDHQPRNMPLWRSLFSSLQPKETKMATELETIAAAVARSEATSEKALLLVQNLSTQLENLRRTTTDPETAAKLLALANELNAESDKVEAAEQAASPAPVAPAPPAPPVNADNTNPNVDPAPVSAETVPSAPAPAA